MKIGNNELAAICVVIGIVFLIRGIIGLVRAKEKAESFAHYINLTISAALIVGGIFYIYATNLKK